MLTLGMAGMGGMVANVVVSNWFVRRRGQAIAITAMGTSVAAIIVPSLAAQMIDLFGQLFGDYPFEAYGAVVVNDPKAVDGAMETQTLSLFEPALVTGDRLRELVRG